MPSSKPKSRKLPTPAERALRQRLGQSLAEQFNVGQRVLVTKDDGSVDEHNVTQMAWKLGHGDWVIGLSGISGGYDITRVRPVQMDPS
jgi:hypothetical protein